MTPRIRLAAVTVVLVAAQTLPALPARADTAQTVSFQPVADTYVWTGDSGAVNYGSQVNISVLYGTGAARARALLRFDLSSIPADATVTAATLGLVNAFTSGEGTIDTKASRVTAPWDESTVTWYTQPSASDTISSSLLIRDPGTRTWDFVTAVRNWISGTWQNDGVILIGRETGASSETYTRSFWSRESASPPTLSVTYSVPADTRAPTVSGVAVSNITETSVTITWTTDENGTSKVEYGTTAAYGTTTEDATLSTVHTVVLTGLSAGATYHFRASSADSLGNTGVSGDQTVTAAPSTAVPGAGRLIKTACPASAAADHPCRAVYYQGSDGNRHAFPNEKIYRTWYADFSTVQTVSESEMASLALGENVRYRPGVRLVKFQTLPKVYAVSRGGALRWLQTETLASALYGTDWNKKIDDLSDAFVADYTFGADIVSATDYIPSSEMNAAKTIDADQGR